MLKQRREKENPPKTDKETRIHVVAWKPKDALTT